jgi:superfamily II DNA/RNA helicase
LNEPKGNQPPLNKKKCLIFTQYADTAAYLYQNLNSTKTPAIEVIYGVDKNKATIVGRFSPIANPEHRPKENVPEIHILIATDVLSEGLNLQDCDQVINYDLHWNPVHLIQRFGRVDRIGSEHDVVYAYNFLPETELDSNLGLREKLRRRIQEIHDTIGEDTAILDPSERINEQAFYSIYHDHRLEETDEAEEDQMVDLNEATEIIRQLREDQPELFQSIVDLRDGIRSGYSTNRDGEVVLC